MKKETNTMQDYVKIKKNTKNLKWRHASVGKPTTKRQKQLDRIERKLDELLSRPVYAPPSQWNTPAFWTVPPRREEEPRYPRDYFGNPVPYSENWQFASGNHNGGAR